MRLNINPRDRHPPYDPEDPTVGGDFGTWCVNLQHWILETRLSPRLQAAAIVQSLQSVARLEARTLEPEGILNDGEVNVEHLDPALFILARLRRRPARQDEGTRINAITEFVDFAPTSG